LGASQRWVVYHSKFENNKWLISNNVFKRLFFFKSQFAIGFNNLGNANWFLLIVHYVGTPTYTYLVLEKYRTLKYVDVILLDRKNHYVLLRRGRVIKNLQNKVPATSARHKSHAKNVGSDFTVGFINNFFLSFCFFPAIAHQQACSISVPRTSAVRRLVFEPWP